MGLVIALAWHVVMGGLCAHRARLYLESRGERWGLPFIVALASAGLVGGPAAVFIFRFFGAYFMHFFVNPMGYPAIDTWGFALSLAVLVSTGLATTAGYAAVRYASDKMHPPYNLAPVAAVGLIALVFAAVCWNRVFLVGEIEQFQTSSTRPIWAHLVGALSIVPILTGAMAALACGRWFKEEKTSMPPVAAR